MPRLRYFVADAFADGLFQGNPAGVCLLERGFLPEALMQSIAAENNLAETAFLVKRKGIGWDLRWFTPETEIDLCGHATLASAFVLSRQGEKEDPMRFFTRSGELAVSKKDDFFELDFPARPPKPIPVTDVMEQALGVRPAEAHLSRDYLLLLESRRQVRELVPRWETMARLTEGMGIIVTAKGEGEDFVSRFFAPSAGVPEDPVTGSAHSTLIPFWAERLGKDKMTARQLSKRGGTLYCVHRGDRVGISGKAVLYSSGTLHITE